MRGQFNKELYLVFRSFTLIYCKNHEFLKETTDGAGDFKVLKHEQREISKYGMKGNNWMMSKSISSGNNLFYRSSQHAPVLRRHCSNLADLGGSKCRFR